MKLHKEKIVHHKAEMDFLPETAILLPNQSDDDFHPSSKHHDDWSSSSDEHSWEKGNNCKMSQIYYLYLKTNIIMIRYANERSR